MKDSLSDVSFRGSAAWIHAREGSGLDYYGCSCYWPGGQSGVTLDPGFDLGYQTQEDLHQYYRWVLTGEQMAACVGALGLRGKEARSALTDEGPAGEALRSIRIPREKQEVLFGIVAVPYWQKITGRFPQLESEDCPPAVQTALLSLAYNRGPYNRALGCLAWPLEEGNWEEVADRIYHMQQSHRLKGVRKRRRQEAELIRLGLEPASSNE